MLSKMSKKQKKRRQPMLINMLKTDERFQHKAAKEPSRCLCSRFWASASLCDCAVPACRNYFTAASTRCTGRRTATVRRHSYHAKLCQQATVPCHPGGGEFGPDGGAKDGPPRSLPCTAGAQEHLGSNVAQVCSSLCFEIILPNQLAISCDAA